PWGEGGRRPGEGSRGGRLAAARQGLPRQNGWNGGAARRDLSLSPLREPGLPAFDRACTFLGARPGNETEVLAGPPAQLLVGRQPDDRIGIPQSADQCC